MHEPQFEWDAAKAALNLMKHRVSFAEAMTVFEDDFALYKRDPYHSVGEERFVIIGVSSGSNLLVVVHCEREAGEVIRLISARPANRLESAMYSSRNIP